MKILKLLIAIPLLLTLQISFPDSSSAVRANPNSKNNVLDYYLKLPDKYFLNVKNERAARLKYAKIRDIPNGYLKIEMPYQLQKTANIPAEDRFVIEAENHSTRLSSQMEVALFKHDEGRHIVAVAYRWSGDCSACAFPKIDFWQDDNGALTDVTEMILSQINLKTALAEYARLRKSDEDSEPDLVYELPRTGRTIKVVTDRETLKKRIELLNVKWTGREFTSELTSGAINKQS